mmetsp:Transcript_10040/g.20017  ORF Transcript_10040/g.20017 Transcript_10040/m.20017 type:complete len:133 (-) Transcript_10040:218-616(-)
MGSACCSDSAQLSREAKQESTMTAEEYRAALTEDAVVLRMTDAPAVATSKAGNRHEKARSNGATSPPVSPPAPAPPAAKVSAAEEKIIQSDADPDLRGIEMENLCLSAEPNFARDDGREALLSLSAKPNWKR